jgi:hypothetical protein
VAAGIRRVVYIYPYPKSHATELYPDSLSIDMVVGSASQIRCEPFILKLYRLMYVAMLPAAISPPGELVAERSV